MPDSHHLTAEELDLLLIGNPAQRVTSHIETCASCRTMALLDGDVVAALSRLPMVDPRPDFADRVMCQVSLVPMAPSHQVSQRTVREIAARRRVVGGSLLGGGLLAAGFGWVAANPALAMGWINPGFSSAGRSFWLSLQAVAANASEQPWFSLVADVFATPSRVVLTACAVAGLYAAALAGFQQLLTEPATDAGW